MWGVGCIFVEMITGMPTFPGIRDTYDQLDKIFKLLGTPTEDTWRGVTHLPGYKPHKLGTSVLIQDMNFFPFAFCFCVILCYLLNAQPQLFFPLFARKTKNL